MAWYTPPVDDTLFGGKARVFDAFLPFDIPGLLAQVFELFFAP